uniref:Putative acyl-coenzyme A synthetase n=1 Tax=mine drainage metagenome TaxID=410659 RepID=E6Q284_9ZZZZ
MIDTREEFRWEIPQHFSFARDVVDDLARHDRRALIFIDNDRSRRTYSFQEIALASQRYARVFAEDGIDRGDRVLVALPKRPAWIFTMLALDRIGAVAIPCAEQLRAKDLLYRANHADVRAIVACASNQSEIDEIRTDAVTCKQYYLSEADAPGWERLDSRAEHAEPLPGIDAASDEWSYIIYTSGTTKDPKGVVHDRAYSFAKRMQARFWLDCTPDDLVWSTAATGWAKSLWNVLLGPWSCGSAIVMHDGGFDPAERLDLIRDLGVTVLCQAPTEYRLEAKRDDLGSRWKLPHLRHCVSAGEPLNPEVIERWGDAFGLTIFDGYGQTENSLLIANLPGDKVRIGAMGRPTPGHDVAVVDEDGRPCANDIVGDIGLRGEPPTLFKGYLHDEEQTAATRRGEWYLTGDRARVDADGYFWFVGRADDVISSGAYRIGPFEVESALLEHPAVAESAVVGSPDADRGNIVKAFVVLRPGYSASDALVRELQEHCKRVTAPYKYPREIEFVGDLPKTRSGKIRRVELRERELDRKGRSASSGQV